MRNARATYSGNALGAVDLRRPFGDAAEHPPVVDFLKGLAIDKIAADLSDEHDHRRRILRRRMNADRGVRRARAARDERNAGPPGQLAERLRHVRRAAFLPADDERKTVARVVQRVEHGEIALARNAERMRRALGEKIGDEYLAAGAGGFTGHCVGIGTA